MIRETEGSYRESTWAEAIDLIAERLSGIIAEHGGEAVAGLGGARGTNEDAYAFGKFLRAAVGTNHLDAQLDDGLDPEFLVGVTPRALISDLDRANTILLWAADLKEEIGTLYLRVRRAVREGGARLVVVHPRRTGLDDVAHFKLSYRPGEGATTLMRLGAGRGAFADARAALAEGPVVALVGRTGLTEDRRLAESVAAFARDELGARILPLVRRSNVYGALDMGLAPTLLPGRVTVEAGRAALSESWGVLPTAPGREARGILEGLARGKIKALFLCGADPIRDFPDPRLAREAMASSELTVAVDLFLTDSARMADVVLPAAGFTEKEGSVTNLEGRVQKVNRLTAAPGQARAEWDVFDELASLMGRPIGLATAEMVSKEIAAVSPAYRGFTWDRLDGSGGSEGVVVPEMDEDQPLRFMPVRHSLKAHSIPLALHAARTLYDDGATMRPSRILSSLAPGARAWLHPKEAEARVLHEGDPVVVAIDGSSLELTVGLDPSLREGVLYLPLNQPGVEFPANVLEADLMAAKRS